MALEEYRVRVILIWIVGIIMLRAALDVGVWQRRRVGHNKERPKVVVEEAGSEAARPGETIEAISSLEKEQEV